MQGIEARRLHPELKKLVAEASRALAQLDADRLEELALCCQALNRDLPQRPVSDRTALARQAHEAVGDMAVFARVIEATRSNLQVMKHLRELREGRLEYTLPPLPAEPGYATAENSHGDN